MVQLSAFSLFPATKNPSPLPDLTIKLTPTGPIQTLQPLGGNSRYSIQFNFESLKLWAQFVFMFTGATDSPSNAMAYGVDAMPVEIQSFGVGTTPNGMITGEYVALQPLPIGGVFPATGLDPLEWAKGLWYLKLSLVSQPDGTKKMFVSVRDQATDNVLWSTGSTDFPDFTFQKAEQFPMVFGVEAVGEYSGYATKFLSCDMRVDIETSFGPVYGIMQGDAAIWTYTDGTDPVAPLVLANETGESSNLWTNVVEQNATTLVLDLSLTQGSQTFAANPPLVPPTPLPTPAPTCVYPVSTSSDQVCIFQGFKDSGYWDDLTAAVQAGTYPPGYLTFAKASPAAWLKSHPYLGWVLPNFFTTTPPPTPPAGLRADAGLRAE